MFIRRYLLGLLPAITISFSALVFASPVKAADLTDVFDTKHKTCLERIAVDNEQAYEEALIWQDDGGGRRAKHCVAMALYALGHEDEAANRLDTLAKASDGGTPAMRADFYSEAANFWLISNMPDRAYKSATAGLGLKFDHLDLRIARARAYAMSGYYKYAETDLTSVLSISPKHAGALRYRADARLQQGKLSEAKVDIENALAYDPTVIETALLRGHINEAIRKQQK